MASFDEHRQQAIDNIDFLKSINEVPNLDIRWQITVAYYVALHLLHSFVASKHIIVGDSHGSLKGAISPTRGAAAKLDNSNFTEYEKLELLSRQARYKSDLNITEEQFIKALQKLNVIIRFYNTEFPTNKIDTFDVYTDDNKYVTNLSFINIIQRVTITTEA